MRGQGRRRWRKWVALAAVAGMLVGQTGAVPVWAEEMSDEETQEKVLESVEDEETVETVEESEAVTAEETDGTVEEAETVEVEEEADQTADEPEDLTVEGSQETVEEAVTEGAADTEISEQPTISEDTMEPETTQESVCEEEIAETEEQMETYDANNIASGKDGNITWAIDADGKLTVEGTGDFSESPGNIDFAWHPYRSQITAAEVNVNKMTDVSYLFAGCSNMNSIDISGFETERVTNMEYMFSGCSSLKSLDVSGFDTSNVKNMRYMFSGCSNLKNLDVSGFDTSNVENMRYMFSGCSNLKNLDVSGFDTSNVTDMWGIFLNCSSLTSLDVSGFDTRNVTSMTAMFDGCSNLNNLDVSGFDTSNTTEMGLMFYDCSNLTNLDVSRFDTSNVENMRYMFYACSSLKSLDVSGFDTSSVIGMAYMFSGCSNVLSLNVNKFDTHNVMDMWHMFSGCSSLNSLDVSGFDTSNVTAMDHMFYDCSNLTSIDISSFNTSNVTDTSAIFLGCINLKTIKTPHIMGTEAISLPGTFINEKGTETQVISKEFCNTTLNKKELPKPTPVSFTVVGVIGGRNVTCNNSSEDAVIYYSSKTSNLTTSDTCVKPGETVLFENFYGTIYAKAYANGQWSNVSRLILKIPVVNKPTITSKDGVVTIRTTTPDSYIYYTTDGSTPSPTNGTRLAKSGGSFTVPVNCTVKAIAVRSCFTNSEVVSAKVAARKLGAPSFVVKGVIGGREVTFNSTEKQGEIYYSFTTSNITTRDKHVKPGEKVLFQNYYGTVYAKSYVNGQWSNVSRLILKIPVVNKPTITAAGNGKVKISTSTPDCAIYYTTDGSTPSPTNGIRINSSSSIVTVGNGKTVKAIAVRSCFTNSDVATY